jgi:putative hydrolase of HD superfamily
MELGIASRLEAQFSFLLAADGLKSIIRANSVADGSRKENSAEHTWHVALMALVLAEHCPEPIDVGKVLTILIIHDLVEVYAGDASIYDDEAVRGQADREEEAARRMFQLLPVDQCVSMASLWREFEDRSSAEGRFARAVDALAPTWLHWGEHAHPSPAPLTAKRVMERKTKVLSSYPVLFELLERVVNSALDRGLISP